MRLPKGFIYGGATAAYQAEGETTTHGKGKVAWDDYLKEQGLFQADPASDFYHQYPIDLKLCHQFGINGIRVSIAWSRIFPLGEGTVNQEGVAFYHDLFKECKKQGVEPFVTLHHFDTPDTLHKQGDFLSRHTVDCFVAYAEFCFQEYPEIHYWITFNELWPVAVNQYIAGTFPPCEKFQYDKALQSMHHMMLAHAKAVNLYKEEGRTGEIGIIHSLEGKYPYENTTKDHHAAMLEDALANRYLLDLTFQGAPSTQTKELLEEILTANHVDYDFSEDEIELRKAAIQNDFLGINYYQSSFVHAYEGENEIHHNGTGDKGTSVYRLRGIGEHILREDVERTDWDWLIYPEGLYDMMVRIAKDYPTYKALYVTENGLGYKDEFMDGIILDEPRINYIRKHLNVISQAVKEGICVKGYFVWSLMDVFSWSNGYNKRYGLFYVDYDTQKRYPKASAYWYRQIAKSDVII